MTKIKLPLLMAAALFPCLTALAGNPVMMVKTLEGKTLTVNLVDNMYGSIWVGKTADSSVNFYVYTGYPVKDETGRPVTSEGDQSGTVYLDMPVSSLEEIKFFEDSSAVNDIDLDADIKVDVAEGLVSVTGVQKAVRVIISDLSGILIHNGMISSDAVFNLKEAGAGVYVVNVDGSQFKLLVK